MMLAISSLSRAITKDELDMTSFSDLEDQFADFPEFSAPAGCLLDSIDFDDVLPDLEIDPADFMADFSFSAGDVIDDEDADTGIQIVPEFYKEDNTGHGENGSVKSGLKESKDDGDENEKSMRSLTRSCKEKEKSKKSQAKKSNSSNEGKRKTKVDWTPELHRRFVEAVEKLGVDKAVPSRILELMGIHCLTRHNVASHLQKYRSHRKHSLAREAEAASWTQKRQMYGIAVTPTNAGIGGKTKTNHGWHSPAIGFPPVTPAPSPIQHHHRHHPYRPLHVWGHPTPHHIKPQTTVMPMWHKQPTTTFWHPHHHAPNAVTTQTSCFPQALPATRFAAAPPPHPTPTMYKHQPTPPGHPPIDLHPTKESIDAVLGDVLSKPWLPLPIGLKPPSMDSVMVELHRQGVPKIPPS